MVLQYLSIVFRASGNTFNQEFGSLSLKKKKNYNTIKSI